MKLIRSTKVIKSKNPNGSTILYMLGYGGRMWQATRHLNVLTQQGYTLFVIDFVDILRDKRPQNLVELMDEVEAIIIDNKLNSPQTIIIGVSLGGLVGFNMVKRFNLLTKLLVITGGDMTHIPSRRSLTKGWGLSRGELARYWQNVNIYTPEGQLRGKHMTMLLPKRDKVIDPHEVAQEISLLAKHNDVKLVTTTGGHFRTIITQTIIFPQRSLPYIEDLARHS